MTADTVLTAAVVVPGQAPSGIYGPSCQARGELDAPKVNEAGRILPRRVELHTNDGGRSPDAVAGWHTSAVRRSIADGLRGSVPYVYPAV